MAGKGTKIKAPKNKSSMSKEELEACLKALNIRIDKLIIAGKSYAKEAAEHRRLIRALR